MKEPAPRIDRDSVVRLWLHQQGLSKPRGLTTLSKRRLSSHLVRTGGLQLDPINAVDRAHYLTLWSRFGPYTRQRVDDWIYRDRIGFEYWGHEASIVALEHLALGRRRMKAFPPKNLTQRAWWRVYDTSAGSKRRVLRRLREDGPKESTDLVSKEDKRSLQLLWHAGRVAVTKRRHFRRVYDLAERVYPPVTPATTRAFEDSWLLRGLAGNGIASEGHLAGYITGPSLTAAERTQALARNIKAGRIVEIRVPETRRPYYALPEHLDILPRLPEPSGTTLLCPFDSLLWQRQRAQELLGFHYRIEIYTPPPKREFGYYTLPILHGGALVGRLDPKLHRDRNVLEIKALRLEPGVTRDAGLTGGLGEALRSLGTFLGATSVILPRSWRNLL